MIRKYLPVNVYDAANELGRFEAWISKHLGMDKDEILRLKQITGIAALFKDVKFGNAWIPAYEECYDTDESDSEEEELFV